MTDFLLELRSEEIPARMQDKARDDLARLFTAELDKAGLKAARITTYATPRRLTVIAHDLPLETQAVSEETKGPKTGAPPQALDGFLRKTGLTQDQLVERDGVYFAVVEKPGRATAQVLSEAVPAIIRAFPWPKSMRWGAASRTTESLRWVRPLQGIIALLGSDVVPVDIDGITADRDTMGHRFHSKGAVTISDVGEYVGALRAAHVIVDQEERRAIIRAGAERVASVAGLRLIPDEGLVNENSGLTEWPVPLLGRFDAAFLEVPPEVIQLTARVNQKYFVCEDASGNLANAFVCTANVVAKDGGQAIVAGNEKVIAARLSDARFFWEQDQKTPLEEHAQKLSRITFHEKLGSVADKVDRVAKLARWLVEEGIVKGADADQAEQAARLAKADLVTEMVGEFPELQGLMGGYYARKEGLPDAVADAIRDHYKPVGQGDDVPAAPITVAVALADKLDTLASFFWIDQKPTGSKDPFALRRASLSIIALILDNSLRVPLKRAASRAAQMAAIKASPIQDGEFNAITLHELATLNSDELNRALTRVSLESALSKVEAMGALLAKLELIDDDLLDFFADRLKVQQKEAGVRHDLIDAVFALGNEDDLVRLLARVHALQAFISTEDGKNLHAGFKRAANILKKEGVVDAGDAGVLGYTPEPAEAALIAAVDAAQPKAEAAIAAEDFAGAMAALASLRGPIDAFFDDVTVNDDDPAKRNARLSLLARFRDTVNRVADFSRIEG